MATTFTPFASLGGGALIGLAAVLLMATLGRVLGATGILAAALLPAPGEPRGWRLAFILGTVSAPLAYATTTGAALTIDAPVTGPALIVGGLLVGVGVTLGSGCTSGHGVCGLARLSPRSMIAVATFMTTAAASVFVVRHVWGG